MLYSSILLKKKLKIFNAYFELQHSSAFALRYNAFFLDDMFTSFHLAAAILLRLQN